MVSRNVEEENGKTGQDLRRGREGPSPSCPGPEHAGYRSSLDGNPGSSPRGRMPVVIGRGTCSRKSLLLAGVILARILTRLPPANKYGNQLVKPVLLASPDYV